MYLKFYLLISIFCSNCISTNLIQKERLEKIVLGMKVNEVLDTLGNPENSSHHEIPLEVTYLNYKSNGLSIVIKNGEVNTIFYYSGKVGGYENGMFKKYNGKLPYHLDLNFKPDDIISLFRVPNYEGSLDLVTIPSKYISYNDPAISINFRSDNNEIIYISYTNMEKKEENKKSIVRIFYYHKDLNHVNVLNRDVAKRFHEKPEDFSPYFFCNDEKEYFHFSEFKWPAQNESIYEWTIARIAAKLFNGDKKLAEEFIINKYPKNENK